MPDVFHRVDFGTIGWLLDQAHSGGNDQLMSVMPAGPINLHDDEVLGEGLADLLEEEIHHGRRSLRQNQREHFSLRGSNSGVDIHIFSDDLCWDMGADAWRSPTPSRTA